MREYSTREVWARWRDEILGIVEAARADGRAEASFGDRRRFFGVARRDGEAVDFHWIGPGEIQGHIRMGADGRAVVVA